eukprot:3927618-Pyramimonas_sp.AAC.1
MLCSAGRAPPPARLAPRGAAGPLHGLLLHGTGVSYVGVQYSYIPVGMNMACKTHRIVIYIFNGETDEVLDTVLSCTQHAHPTGRLGVRE